MRTIKLMADYGCYPLWEASPGCIGNIDPEDLPISEELKQALMKWADVYNDILNWSDPTLTAFPSKEAEDAFKKKAEELGDQYSIIVFQLY